MAINISTDPLYVGRFTAAGANYPFGSAKNETVPGSSNDGTPIILNFVDDYLGFHQAILEEDGETPTGNADTAIASQYFDGLMRTSDIYPNLIDTGAVNAIVITPSPAITAYKIGQHFKVSPLFDNTGAVTINISGIGVISVVKRGLAPLVAFDILLGEFYDFILLSPTVCFVQDTEIPNLEEKVSADPSASLEFKLDPSFKTHRFDLYNVRPVADAARMFIRISDDNGATFESGGSDYIYALQGVNGATGAFVDNSNGDTAIRANTTSFNSGVGQAAGEFGINGVLFVLNPGSATQTAQIMWDFSYVNAIGETVRVNGGGSFVTTNVPITDIKFDYSGTNISTGTIRRSSQ